MAVNFAAPAFLALQPDDQHRAFWQWLGSQVEGYPKGVDVPPLRHSDKPGRPRRFEACELQIDPASPRTNPQPIVLTYHDGKRTGWTPLGPYGRDVEFLERTILAGNKRGTYMAFWNGARLGFHVLLRHYATALVARGWHIKPIATGTEIKAVILQRDKHAYFWVDCQAMTGLADCDRETFVNAFTGGLHDQLPAPVDIYRALHGYQSKMLETFGVGLTMTIGMAAVRASQRFIPDDAWLWRPTPGMVALCRAGGGYRGGYVYAQPYRGPAEKFDINRLYTWALTQPLPLRAAVGKCVGEGRERPGIYLCRVWGPGSMPAYLAPFRGPFEGCRRRLWNGADCLAVLPQAEFAGLRALGYGIQPGWGYVFTETFTLLGFARCLDSLTMGTERGSPEYLIGKGLGNSLYGKLAEPSSRPSVVYATECPPGDWWPFITDEGEEIAGLWVRRSTSYRGHQQIGAAATITGVARSKLYSGLAALTASGAQTLAVDTDGILCTPTSGDPLHVHPSKLGRWRHVESDTDAVIPGPKRYALGSTVKVAGVQGATKEALEIAYQNGSVYVAGKRMAPPWVEGPMIRDSRKAIYRAGSEQHTSASGPARRGWHLEAR